MHVFTWRRTRQEEEQIGVLHPRNIDLATVDTVAVALARGGGRDTRGIGAGVGLSDAEGL